MFSFVFCPPCFVLIIKLYPKNKHIAREETKVYNKNIIPREAIFLKKLGFIGTGNMGGALILAAAKSNSENELLLADKIREKADALAEKTGGKVVDNITVAQCVNTGKIPTTWRIRHNYKPTFWVNCSYSSICMLLRMDKLEE